MTSISQGSFGQSVSGHGDAKPATRVLIHGSLIHRHRGQARSHSSRLPPLGQSLHIRRLEQGEVIAAAIPHLQLPALAAPWS